MPRYINQLQEKLERKEEDMKAANQQITDLMYYLTSDKFNCGSELDGYVNVSDVLTRLATIRSLL